MEGNASQGCVTQTNIDKVIKTSSHPFPESPAHPAWSTVSCEAWSGGLPNALGLNLINPSLCQLPLTPGTTPGPEPRVVECQEHSPGGGGAGLAVPQGAGHEEGIAGEGWEVQGSGVAGLK